MGRFLRSMVAVTIMAAAVPALAGMRTEVTNTTVTTSSGNCLAAKNNRMSLTLDATGASANIGYCHGAACTAAIGTVGTTTIPAGTLHYWGPPGAPTDGFCFISASGSQPLTIKEGF